MSDTTLDPQSGTSEAELHARRRALIERSRSPDGREDADRLTPDELRELVFICASLRSRTAGPPKTARPKTGTGRTNAKPKVLDDI